MPYVADVLLFGLVLAALGLLALCCWKLELSTLENLLIPPGLFFGAYALLVWLTGTVWKLVPGFWLMLPWPLLLLLCVLRRRTLKPALSQCRQALRGISRTEALLSAYVAVVCGLTFLFCLAPPTGNDYDSLVYHLAAPAQYLRHGRILELPYDHHSYFPFTLEMWFLLGLAAKGPVLAKLFHWVMMPVGALTLVALASSGKVRAAGFWAAALYVSMPLIPLESSTAYIDLGFAAFTLLAVLTLVRASQSDKPTSWLIWSGAFCGFTLGTKYFGALIFGFLGLWLLGEQIRAKRLSAKQLAAFAAPALLLGAPWYVRNALWTGNPVYPFAYEVFGGQWWTLEMARQYTADQAKFGFGKSLVDLVWLPWRLAMTPMNFQMPYWPFQTVMGMSNNTNGSFEVLPLVMVSFAGPAWIAAGLPAFGLKSKPRSVVIALSFFSFLFVFWAVTSQQIRYLIPGMALLCLAGGWAVVRLSQIDKHIGRLPQIFVSVWLLVALIFVYRQGGLATSVALGEITPEAYLLRTFPGYPAMQWAGAQTAPGAVFAVYGEPRVYYLNRDYFWADPDHSTWIPYRKISSGKALVDALVARKATHVLWNTVPGENGGGFGPPPIWQDAVNQGLAVELFEARGYKIFELRP